MINAINVFNVIVIACKQLRLRQIHYINKGTGEFHCTKLPLTQVDQIPATSGASPRNVTSCNTTNKTDP